MPDNSTLSTSVASKPADHGRRAWFALEMLGLLVVCFVIGGAPAPHVNETHYLTKATHYWDGSYCPRDFFLASADAHLVFYWSIGWLTKFCPLVAVAWLGRVASWTLIAAGWRELWYAVSHIGESRASAKSALGMTASAALFFVLLDKCNFAGEWVVGGVEGKCFAYGFMFFGLAAIVRGAWRFPWIWFGAASAFHPLVGGWAVLTASIIWLFEQRHVDTPFRQVAAGLFVGGLLALPGVVPALALERGVDPPSAAEAARVYVFDRLPHHLAPLSQPWSAIHTRTLRFIVLSAAMCALCWWSRREGRSSGLPTTLRPLFAFALISLAFNLAAIAIELALADRPLVAARLLRYYWYRQADVAVPMVVGLAVALLAIGWLASPVAWRKIAATVPMVWAGWSLLGFAVGRWKDPTPPAAAKMEAPADWIAACQWVSKHTPSDALCFVPRHGQSFKWYASRADLGNWKDLPQDAAGILEWRRRMTDMFTIETVRGENAIVGEPVNLGTRRVRELAAEYDADYVVTLAEPPLALKQVFPVKSDDLNAYAVYEIGYDGSTTEPANAPPR